MSSMRGHLEAREKLPRHQRDSQPWLTVPKTPCSWPCKAWKVADGENCRSAMENSFFAQRLPISGSLLDHAQPGSWAIVLAADQCFPCVAGSLFPITDVKWRLWKLPGRLGPLPV